MKSKLLILIFICISIMGSSDFSTYIKLVEKLKTIQLFKVSITPTMKSEQVQGKIYLSDYEVMDTIMVSSENQELLKKALINSNNYSEDDSKRCPFIGKYAMQIDTSLVLVFSLKPCSKISVLFEENGENIFYDLTVDNGIEVVFGDILGK